MGRLQAVRFRPRAGSLGPRRILGNQTRVRESRRDTDRLVLDFKVRKTKMSTIQIRTEIPGPKSRALMSRREAAIPRGPSSATPVFAASAQGATIDDVDGNRYRVFPAGIGCLNIGHRSPRVLSAIR